MKLVRKIYLSIPLVLVLALSVGGCKREEKNTEIILTKDFEENELFRIDSASCDISEAKVYMNTSMGQYEELFGKQIWAKDLGGITLNQDLKDTILARLAQIKVMNLLSEEYELSLPEETKDKIERAADRYIKSYSDDEINRLGIDRERIIQMYSEYALANMVYEEVTKDINPEISDDEARTIKVKHLLIKNYVLDSNGNKVEFSKGDDKKARKLAEKAYEELVAGADFDEIVAKYNQDDKVSYSFMKGDMPKEFEEAAFNLGNDEISEIVKTEYGYHIIKCMSTFDQEETDSNKRKIVQKRKNEAFDEIYTQFVKTLHSNLNEELWNSVDFEESRVNNIVNFFENYDGTEK